MTTTLFSNYYNVYILPGKVKHTLDCPSDSLRLVLEEDGTDVDDDEALAEYQGGVLLLLQGQESWEPKCESRPDGGDLVPASADRGATQDPRSTFGVPSTPPAAASPSQAAQSPETNGGKTITPSTPLPRFSSRITQHLVTKTEYQVWRELISETANHYMGINPKIETPTKYKVIGKAMVNAFPSIEREGEHPWVRSLLNFVKC